MAIATDAFTDTNGVQLTAHGTAWTSLTGTNTPDIQSNALAPDAVDADQFCYNNSITPGADQYAQIKATGDFVTGFSIGPAIRLSTSAITGYFIFHQSNMWELWKVVNDSYTKLGTASRSLTANDVLRLEATGTTTTTIVFKVNGSTITTVADSSSPITSGRVGAATFDILDGPPALPRAFLRGKRRCPASTSTTTHPRPAVPRLSTRCSPISGSGTATRRASTRSGRRRREPSRRRGRRWPRS